MPFSLGRMGSQGGRTNLDGGVLQPQSGAKGRMKKIMAVALARKLLVALWRAAETGVVPEGARLAAA